MRIKTERRAVVCLITLLLTLPRQAASHQLRASMTTVLFNDRAGRIEVNHRFYAHDAEQVMAELLGAGADVLDSEEDRYRFGVYVHQRFGVSELAGDVVPLTLRGVELEGDFLWVYQAAAIPAQPLRGLAIEHRALRDVWPDQVNTVNVERAGRVQTLTFRDYAGRLEVVFPE